MSDGPPDPPSAGGAAGGAGGGAASGPDTVVCSARDCREPARWALRWNNPKIHPPERRKTWTACEAHRESLSDFLGRREFLREVEPLD